MTPILADSEFVMVMAVMGGLVAIISIVVCNLRGFLERKEYERSRRDVAAYVAEGSMTPEQGERMLAVGMPKKEDE